MYYSGWAMTLEFRKESKRAKEAAGKVDRERDIESFTKNPRYGRTDFEGKLKEGNKVTEFQLLAWADGGNLCFGGECQITGRTFKGSYYTD